MSNGILVFIEHRNGVLNKTSLEAVAAAQLLGSAAASSQLPQWCLDLMPAPWRRRLPRTTWPKVVNASNAKLAEYTPDGYSDAMERMVRQLDPHLVVMPHTYLVRDFAPKLAARFGKSLISDCIRAEACRRLNYFHATNLPRQARRGCCFRWRDRRCLRRFNPVLIGQTRRRREAAR